MNEARRALNKSVTEAQLQRTVIELAETFGWRWHHETDSRWSRAGLPDLILVRPPRVIFVELKKEDGALRRAQGEWLTDLARCPGVESYVWRPSDLSEVEEVLKR